jgi:lysophospholipase L1-like esterase
VTDGLGGKVRWTNNAAGFRSDRNFTQQPLPGVLRVLSLGDSFTAGYRVGQHETFSYLQEQWINRQYGIAEVMVAEISDPANALYYLDRFGLQLKPHIVLLGITLGNDIAQAYQGLDSHGAYILTRGDGKVHIEKNHKPMISFRQLAVYKIPPAYLISQTPGERFIRQISRWIKRRRLLRRFYQEDEAITSWGDREPPGLFDATNGFGMFTNPPPPEIEEAYRRLFRILEAFSVICRQHGMIFAVQYFPNGTRCSPRTGIEP